MSTRYSDLLNHPTNGSTVPSRAEAAQHTAIERFSGTRSNKSHGGQRSPRLSKPTNQSRRSTSGRNHHLYATSVPRHGMSFSEVENLGGWSRSQVIPGIRWVFTGSSHSILCPRAVRPVVRGEFDDKSPVNWVIALSFIWGTDLAGCTWTAHSNERMGSRTLGCFITPVLVF
jgi:hypothetical protein